MSLGPRPVFNVGDWGFYEYKLVQIEEMNEGRITSVRDGYFEMGGCDMEVLPLTLHNKVWSEEFAALRHKLHEKGSSGLNYPACIVVAGSVLSGTGEYTCLPDSQIQGGI
jgi:hypothetical protein